MIYLAACTRDEADRLAERHGWKWPEYRYVASVEHLRQLRPNATIYFYDGDRVQDTIARLHGHPASTYPSRLTPIFLEAQRRDLTIVFLS